MEKDIENSLEIGWHRIARENSGKIKQNAVEPPTFEDKVREWPTSSQIDRIVPIYGEDACVLFKCFGSCTRCRG